MLSRRDFLTHSAQLGALAAFRSAAVGKGPAAVTDGIVLNDVQSQLNPTRVHQVVQPTTIDAIQTALRDARRQGRAVSVAGGPARHGRPAICPRRASPRHDSLQSGS